MDGEVFLGGDRMTAAFGDYDRTGLSHQTSLRLALSVSDATFGQYECAAFNSELGAQVMSGAANITYDYTPSSSVPEIEWELPPVLVVSEGKYLVLPCRSVASTEPAKISWYFGRYPVDESRRVYILANDSLAFFPIVEDDAGTYFCTASNSKGTSESPVLEMKVSYLRTDFLRHPSDTFAYYGQDVVLPCQPPKSLPPASVVWYKNYKVLDLSLTNVKVVDHDLHLLSVRKSDNGVYYCVAVNNLTTPSTRTSLIATVRLEGPPIMLQPPVSTKVTKGDSLHLSCLVEADPEPVTSWLFQGLPVPPSDKLSIVNRGQELFVNDMGKAWEGQFTCVSKNRYGNAAGNASVVVIVPPASLHPIGQLTAREGRSYSIECPIVGDPVPDIRWYHNGVDVSLSKKSSLGVTLTLSSLVIANVTVDHAGSYQCVGSNEAGQTSSEGKLIVNVAPVIVLGPADVTEVIGSRLTLECDVKGHPVPSIHWLYNGSSVLPQDVDASEENHKLTISSLGWAQVGQFECVADSSEGTATASAFVRLMVPPKIEEVQFPTTAVRQGQEISFGCTASGIPSPSMQWVHQGKVVRPSLDGRIRTPALGSVVIERAESSDSGLYECRAESSVGTDSRTMSLFVYGEDFFSCTVHDTYFFLPLLPPYPHGLSTSPGAAAPYVSEVNGVDVSLSEKSALGVTLTLSSLVIANVTVDHAGSYQCVGSNDAGQTSSEGKLIVNVAPVIVLGPADVTEVIGSRLTLECDVKGHPVPSIHWLYNVSADVQLFCSQRGPPIMLQPPVSTKVTKGDSLHLSCLVEADPEPVTSWLFQGLPVPPSDKLSIVNRGQELFVNDMGKAWEGQFTCVSKNRYGNAAGNASVVVIVPPASLHPIGQLTAREGGSYSIECPIVGDPVPDIRWYHNGVDVSLSKKSSLGVTLTLSSLVIANVTVDHAGSYQCVGSNEAGQTSSEGKLIVNVAPVIVLGPADVTEVIGSRLTLECDVKGHPVPSIHWLYNGSSVLPQDVDASEENHKLTISSLGWAQVGQFECVADSSEGTATASAFVRLMVPPKIEEVQFPTTAVRQGQEISFGCTASGIPSPSMQWVHQGKVVRPSLDGRIRTPALGSVVIERAESSDSGLYECRAESRVGTDSRTMSLFVYGVPVPPVLLTAVPISSESVYLLWRWSSPLPDFPEIDYFQISFREKSSGETRVFPTHFPPNVTRMEVTGLEGGVAYVFYVTATNDVGMSEPSNLMSANTFQSSPSRPVGLHVLSVGATSATVSWEVPQVSSGVVKLYQLRYRRLDAYVQQEFTYINISKVDSPSVLVEISPLRAFSLYSVQVRAGNVQDGRTLYGEFTEPLTFRTNMTAPLLPPQDVSAVAVDPYSVTVTWQPIPVLAQNGPILFYHLVYMNNESVPLGRERVDNSTTSFTIRGLSPWRWYLVLVGGENARGKGPNSTAVRVETKSVAPVAAPKNFHVESLSADRLQISWQALPYEVSTCAITSYEIRYRVKGDPLWSNVSVSSTSTSDAFIFVLPSLQPWTWYLSQVAAFTDTVVPGLGPYSDVVIVRTMQGESDPVQSLSYSQGPTDIRLTWQTPVAVRGVLAGYLVTYHPLDLPEQAETVSVEETSAHLLALQPSTVYNISVSAVNGAGPGAELVVRVLTEDEPGVQQMTT
ncbi:hemicentin-2, partial [Aplysia californica]|uniref:Hemicentin-2 n=1 Tax=Aplysia californica TaxID=6500 RepID=A0ABM1W3D4_APLCA